MPPSAADAYTALQGFKAPDAQSVLTQAMGQYGVPDQQSRVSDLRKTVNNLQSSLNAVDPSVTGRTAGTFTTEAQRQALVSKEQTPIAQNLNDSDKNLGVANADLGTATGNATTLAQAIMGQNQQTYQKLLDQYNAAAAHEAQQEAIRQFGATQSLEQQKLAEQAREANQTANAKTTSGIDLSQFLPKTSAAPSMSQRMGGGGFNFTDAGGAPISAAKYAALTGNDVAGVLRTMAQHGDTYAANAYKALGTVKTPQARANVIRNYNALFWGV